MDLEPDDGSFERAVAQAEDDVCCEFDRRRPKTNAREVFALDVRAFDAVCSAGMVDATLYVLLCRGTGGDNRTSSWSKKAARAHTKITRSEVDRGFDRLIASRAIERIREGRRPRYRITPAHEFLSDLDPAPQWVWLPNRLVAGSVTFPLAEGETAPLELIRQTQNVDVLRLFIHLYRDTALDEDGGVDWRPPTGTAARYGREKVGEQGEFTIWGFDLKPLSTSYPRLFGDDQERVLAALGPLLGLGLIDIVETLVEAYAPGAAVIHPYPDTQAGQRIERAVTRFGHCAAEAALTPATVAWARERKLLLVPVLAHLQNVQLVGMLRPRYRAQTQRTAAWMARFEEWQRIAERFRSAAGLDHIPLLLEQA